MAWPLLAATHSLSFLLSRVPHWQVPLFSSVCLNAFVIDHLDDDKSFRLVTPNRQASRFQLDFSVSWVHSAINSPPTSQHHDNICFKHRASRFDINIDTDRTVHLRNASRIQSIQHLQNRSILCLLTDIVTFNNNDTAFLSTSTTNVPHVPSLGDQINNILLSKTLSSAFKLPLRHSPDSHTRFLSNSTSNQASGRRISVLPWREMKLRLAWALLELKKTFFNGFELTATNAAFATICNSS